MKVGFSLLTLIPGRFGGSESYVRGLLGQLGDRDDLVVLANRHVVSAYTGRARDLRHVASYRPGRSMPTRAAAMAFARALPGVAARGVPDGLDVLHYPLTVPIPRTRARTVLTLHDVQHHDLPEHFSRAERAYRTWAYDGAARGADRVITVSEHGRRAAIERLGLAPERVRAIHWGIDHGRFNPDGGGDLSAHALPERFLYYPANLWPHKNHERLLEGLARTSDPELGLVLSGETYGRLGRLEAAAERLGVAGRVRHLGYVQPEAVPALYRTAMALVFPSLYEGFGGPTVEAMACGCPVAASSEAALAEVCGDAALPLDPRDPDSIADAIDRVTSDAELRARLCQAGLERAAGFSWKRAAAAHLEVYENAAAG